MKPIKSGQCEFAIPDVPYGTYAIIVGHDVNRDGSIDENPFSSELKGISNYSAKILASPASTRRSSELNKASVTVEIRRVLAERGRRDHPIRPAAILSPLAAASRPGRSTARAPAVVPRALASR